MSLKDRANKLKTDIPAVFIALKREDTPKAAKFFAFVTIAYALSPIDLIPDFIPVLGYLDDILILPAFAALTIHLIPPDIFNECRAQSENLWLDGKPKKWYYAIPVILLWAIIIVLILVHIFKQR